MEKEISTIQAFIEQEEDASIFNVSEQDILAEIATVAKKSQSKGEDYISPKDKEYDSRIVKAYYENPSDANYARIYNRFVYGLRRYAYGFFKDPMMIDDVVITTFEKAWEKRDQYNFDYNYSTWLYNICKNVCLGEIIGKNKRGYIDKDISECFDCIYTQETDGTNPIAASSSLVSITDSALISKEDIFVQIHDASIAAIKEFDDEFDRSLLIAKLLENKRLDIIASEMKKPLSIVKNHLYKAKNVLRDKIIEKHRELFEIWQDFNNEDAMTLMFG